MPSLRSWGIHWLPLAPHRYQTIFPYVSCFTVPFSATKQSMLLFALDITQKGLGWSQQKRPHAPSRYCKLFDVLSGRWYSLNQALIRLHAPGAFCCLGVELNVIWKPAFLSSMSSPRSTLIVLIFAHLIPSCGDRIAEATLSYKLHERRHFFGIV